jgi:uncharacterized protein
MGEVSLPLCGRPLQPPELTSSKWAHVVVLIKSDPLLIRWAIALFGTLLYLAGGLLTRAVVGLALIMGPIYGLGLYAGVRMFGLASEITFPWICFALIATAIAVSVPVLDNFTR